jgi:hypothetical protein
MVHSVDIVEVRDHVKHGILQVEDLEQAEIAALNLNGKPLREGYRPCKV